MNKKSIRDIDVNGKKVLVRCDFNVPQDENGNITDENRIVGALPTIRYLIDNNAKVILCSHLGRPKGGFDSKFSLKPVATRLSELLGINVKMADDVIGDSAQSLCSQMQPKDVVLLENVRFHKEEEQNDPEFAKKLASLAEIYVNDAFGTAHRAHASTEGVSHYLPSVCGFLIQKEIEIMGGALNNPQRPFLAILGGAKVSDKIGVINNLIEKVDAIIIGGGMAFTFLAAQGKKIGKSLCETDKLPLARELMDKASKKGIKFLLPLDGVVADKFANDAASKVVDISNIPDDYMGLDIGPKSVELFDSIIKTAKTVIWNGPMGVFEMDNFANGTKGSCRSGSQLRWHYDNRRRRFRCGSPEIGLCR